MSKEGIVVEPEETKDSSEWPTAKSVTNIQCFLSLISWIISMVCTILF